VPSKLFPDSLNTVFNMLIWSNGKKLNLKKHPKIRTIKKELQIKTVLRICSGFVIELWKELINTASKE